MGLHHTDFNAATRMAEVISLKMHQLFVKNIKSQNAPFSIILDTSTDKGNRNYLFIFIRSLEDFWPLSYFYRSIHLQSETSTAVRDVVLQALREDGLYDLFKRNCFNRNYLSE